MPRFLTATLTFSLILAPFLFSPCAAVERTLKFQQHTINADSTYSSCAAIDIDHDGKLDVISGGWWYQNPTWKKHFVRQVQQIRGRYDGYSHLPIDVNGDGWVDFVTANYRSRSLCWIEHPGKKLTGWKRHVIAEPGPMETGRLADIDGDGDLDILPNGRDFVAWWEVSRNPDGQVQWQRRDLPAELAGHGIGFGDLNGDGRGDLIGPRGWLEAPQDRRQSRWTWHNEFQLSQDSSVPVLVYDVDQDGDSDLVWGKGHGFGLYWLEQIAATSTQPRQWKRHAIDTSWSQPHSLLLADLDGDGRPELVAGKRFLAHDGKDPGAWDAMVICAYQYEPKGATWQRHILATGNRAGFGLDPKAIDLDQDGDLDLICPGRSGLYWLENLLTAAVSEAVPEPAKKQTDLDHTKLMVFRDATGKPRPVKSAADWARRRAEIVRGLEATMGPLPGPERRCPLQIKVLEETKTEKYLRRKITYQAEQGDRVPAYLLIPHNLSKPAKAMLCLHQTTRIGKGEPAGIGGKPALHYAHELAERGYVCLAPDYPSFGDYPYDFNRVGEAYESGTMKAIWNNIRGVDLLQSLPEVAADRIGCIGHSLGGHNTLFTSVFEPRIKAAVTSCGFTAFHHYYGGKLAPWAQDRYMPWVRERYQNDPNRISFDFYEILGALAPRAVFINAPLHDGNFENTGVRKVVSEAHSVYELFEKRQSLQAVYPDCGHDFPEPIRQQVYRWLDQQLKD